MQNHSITPNVLCIILNILYDNIKFIYKKKIYKRKSDSKSKIKNYIIYLSI